MMTVTADYFMRRYRWPVEDFENNLGTCCALRLKAVS